jgi:hypothetical protein
MNPLTFTRRDATFTATVLALIIGCAIYVRIEYDKAFPQASVNLKLSRAEITRRAEDFVRSQSLDPKNFRQLTVFDPDEDARLYLEREVGLERANQLMEREVSVWRWRARWFRPPEKEEILVWLSPDGQVVGFEHEIEEAAAGARLEHDQALAIARQFVSKFSASPGDLVEDRAEQRPNRVDYLFTWEQPGFRAKEATYRRSVVVQGGAAGRYQEFLYVPEKWKREFAGLRSRNELYSGIAQALWVPLVVAALALIVLGLRRRTVPWRPLVQLSGIVGLLQIVSQWNAIPLLVDQYPTSSPYAQTLALILLQSLGAGVMVFFYVIIAAAAGEPEYRRRTGDTLSLRSAFSRQGVATRRFFRAALAGYGLAAAHLAFLVWFYLFGRRFGAWSPQDIQYSDLLSTALPWIYPIAIAAMASSAEEFWFRLLAIPLLQRLLRVRWIAVIIPAFVWGFLHANYPQQPAWIRGVEVGCIGVAAGFVMLRFGIVATLIWHFSIDALLMGLNLFGSASWFYRISAGIVVVGILAPLILSAVLYRRNGGFLDEPELQPDTAVTAPQPAPETAPDETTAAPLAPALPVMWLYAAAAVALVLALLVSPRVFGSWIRIRVDRGAAESIARQRVPQPGHWRTATDFIANLDVSEFEYLRRAAGPDGADKAVRENKPAAVWRTRFFRPLEKEEWRVYVDQSGAVIRTDHILDERAPGARLDAGDAKRRAAALMPAAGAQLMDWSEEKRDNRTDYSFVYENPALRWADARARFSIELHGDEPSNFRRFIKLPEEWLREFTKPSLRDFVVPALAGSAGLPLLLILLRRLGAHETRFHWRVYAWIAIAGFLCATAATLNGLPAMMSGYDTATPEQNYLGQFWIGRGTVVLLAAGGLFALAMTVDVFRQSAIGHAPLNPPSLVRTFAVAVLLASTSDVLGWLRSIVPGPHRSVPVWNVTGLDSAFPGLQALTQGYTAAIFITAAAAVLVFAGMRYMRPRRRVLALALLVLAVGISRSLTVADFAANAFSTLVWIGVAFIVIGTCAADLVGYAVAAFWIAAIGAAWKLIEQSSLVMRWNGIVAAAAAIVVGVLVIWCTSSKGRVPAHLDA